MGIVQFHTQGAPRKFVQIPGLIVILYEASSGIRQIFTDGRPLPKLDDPQPWFYGYSTGKWEGDTLVVETNNLRDDGWLDIVGNPLTDQAKVTERFRRVNFGRMESISPSPTPRRTRSRGPRGTSRTSCRTRTSSSSSARKTITSRHSRAAFLPAQPARLNELAGQRAPQVLPAHGLGFAFERSARRVLLRGDLLHLHRPLDAAVVLQRRDVEDPAIAFRSFAADPASRRRGCPGAAARGPLTPEGPLIAIGRVSNRYPGPGWSSSETLAETHTPSLSLALSSHSPP